jgi:DNA polymerase-3 subunit chi
MAEIGFYHLTRTGADQALPALLGRTLAAGQRAVVLLGSAARVAVLDTALWACTNPDWLPHGTAATGDPDMQPIWLTEADEAPNGAKFAFLLDGRQTLLLAGFTRVFDLFDGQNDASVAAARVRWSAAKAAGHALTYWQQGVKGWERK